MKFFSRWRGKKTNPIHTQHKPNTNPNKPNLVRRRRIANERKLIYYRGLWKWNRLKAPKKTNPNKPNFKPDSELLGSKNRTIYRNTCWKNVEIEMKFWYSGPWSLQEHINEVYMGNLGRKNNSESEEKEVPKRFHAHRAVGGYSDHCRSDGDIDAGSKSGQRTGQTCSLPE